MLIQALHRLLTTILFTSEDVSYEYDPCPTSQAVFSYKDPKVRRMIWNIKYRGNKKLVSYAGKALYDHIKNKIPLESGTLVIPVPISRKRRRERGFNQANLLVKAISRQDTLKLFEYTDELVIKMKETISQTKLTREERMHNLTKAFSVPFPEKVESRNFLIIDDVTTTGSTFSEIKRVLLEAGASRVHTLAVAH